jgi:transposase-like protein
MAEGHSVTAAAAQMGVVSSTIYNWAREHSEFSDALKRGMAARVLYLETKLLCANDAASVAAAMFALKNACPEEWGEKHQVTTGVAEHGNASPE